MNRPDTFGFVLVAALALAAPQVGIAQSSINYRLSIGLMNAGIGNESSLNYKLSSSLGDGYSTAPSASPGYRLTHGLWFGGGGAAAPVLASAVSRRVHGAAGTFDLPLPLTPTAPATEPRQGPSQTVVLTFDKAITDATVAVTEGVASAAAPTFNGNDVVVGLTGVNNQQYVTISLTGVASSDGGAGGSGAVRVGFLVGDVNQSRVVSIADLGLVNAQLAQPVTAANFLKDVNASGAISVADKGIANANLTKALPPP